MKHPIHIIYEDDYLFAVNKPPRLASVPADQIPLNQTALGKIQRQLENQPWKPYLLHRIDYQTSGALLFGKHERDRKTLENIFRHPETRKKYITLVKDIPRGKTIIKKLPARSSKNEVPAQTNYKILKAFKIPGLFCSLIEAEIQTGRKHQIRKHFSFIKHPVVLDSKYGEFNFNRKFRLTFRLGRQALHCSEISFLHPLLNKPVHIQAPLAPDLKVTLKRLGY